MLLALSAGVTTSALALASVLLAALPVLDRRSLATAGQEPGAGCALSTSLGDAVPSRTCLGCHPQGHSHPVDLDYTSAWARDRAGLRMPGEVVRRGLLLPDGRLECVTCHDGRSQWAARIALPPGAPVIPAVITGRAETYEGRGNWRIARATPTPALPPGSAVSPAPLCATCHSLAD